MTHYDWFQESDSPLRALLRPSVYPEDQLEEDVSSLEEMCDDIEAEVDDFEADLEAVYDEAADASAYERQVLAEEASVVESQLTQRRAAYQSKGSCLGLLRTVQGAREHLAPATGTLTTTLESATREEVDTALERGLASLELDAEIHRDRSRPRAIGGRLRFWSTGDW
jgi:septal ring factor EnvC (AmiA/AmiB activator)